MKRGIDGFYAEAQRPWKDTEAYKPEIVGGRPPVIMEKVIADVCLNCKHRVPMCSENGCDEYRAAVDAFLGHESWATKHAKGRDKNGNTKPCKKKSRPAVAMTGKRGRPVAIAITCMGETHSMREWSRITGIAYTTLYYRYVKGCAEEEILGRGQYEVRKHEGSDRAGGEAIPEQTRQA